MAAGNSPPIAIPLALLRSADCLSPNRLSIQASKRKGINAVVMFDHLVDC